MASKRRTKRCQVILKWTRSSNAPRDAVNQCCQWCENSGVKLLNVESETSNMMFDPTVTAIFQFGSIRSATLFKLFNSP